MLWCAWYEQRGMWRDTGTIRSTGSHHLTFIPPSASDGNRSQTQPNPLRTAGDCFSRSRFTDFGLPVNNLANVFVPPRLASQQVEWYRSSRAYYALFFRRCVCNGQHHLSISGSPRIFTLCVGLRHDLLYSRRRSKAEHSHQATT